MVKLSLVSRSLPPLSLLRSSWRFFWQHPWQFWLTLLSISLGSAVMIAVDLANHSAQQSFSESVNTVSGKMTHRLVGGAQGLDEQWYAKLRVKEKYRRTTPVVEGEINYAGERYQLIGIDWFAESLFDSKTSASDNAFSITSIIQLLTRPNSIMLSRRVLERQNMSSSLANPLIIHVEYQDKLHALSIVGFFNDEQDAALENILLTDIATAQVLLGKVGYLDRIEMILTGQEAAQLSAVLPKNIQLQPAQNKNNALEQMTQAFRTNLSAMSLLAMLVGAFLVYNTMTFSVLQRRRQFAIERMLGTTGSQLFLQTFIEAIALGLLGSLIGVVLGVILGQSLLALVTQTINDLYAAVNLKILLIQPGLLLKGVGITLIAVLMATFAPAWEAAKTQPINVSRASVLENHFQSALPGLQLSGLLILLIAITLLFTFSRNLTTGFVSLFLIVIAYSLWIPSMTAFILKGLSHYLNKAGMIPIMAIRGIQASLSRTNLTIIALAIAVSATVGVGIMITSFRASVADWLGFTLQSDLYISATSDPSSRADGALDDFWLSKIDSIPGIRSVSTGRTSKIVVNEVPTPLLVLNTGQHGKAGFNFLSGDSETVWRGYDKGEVVLVSEPFSYHQKLKTGDSFSVLTNAGHFLTLKIGAVFQDYSASQGMVVMPSMLYRHHWKDNSISSIGLLLSDDANIPTIRQQLGTWAQAATEPVSIRSNKEIREMSLRVFDRTFAITHVLRLLVIIVAFVGVFSALMAVLLERSREFSVLRATGMTPRQLSLMVILQTVIIGVLAGLFAIPLGWAMSEILIHVINQRSFGWTMSRSFPPFIVIQALLLAVGAAVLAGLYPMRRISRLPIRQGLREL